MHPSAAECPENKEQRRKKIKGKGHSPQKVLFASFCDGMSGKQKTKAKKRSKGKGTAPKKFYLHPSAAECPENKEQRRKRSKGKGTAPKKFFLHHSAAE
ncbi:MAG: hypothetical protein E7604_08320 [Ruminococcaceae bacterium]|nr:hypothetical protein [Oscillospiraceae bacterium]